MIKDIYIYTTKLVEVVMVPKKMLSVNHVVCFFHPAQKKIGRLGRSLPHCRPLPREEASVRRSTADRFGCHAPMGATRRFSASLNHCRVALEDAYEKQSASIGFQDGLP
jgi:hypothetical protein